MRAPFTAIALIIEFTGTGFTLLRRSSWPWRARSRHPATTAAACAFAPIDPGRE
jgi:CIC family chloride channel protein